ncbi:hypothetical protein BS17DRAFT_763324 [Gyrodon lividus]|nr:hypothetical protein BS17DRAFT_763324 [Gyrodon lividus]
MVKFVTSTEQQRKEPAALDTNITLAICPSKGCFENIPSTVFNTLRAKIKKRKALIDANGPDARGVGRLELEICLQITNKCNRESLRCHAIANDWPVVIDFASLPEHVERLKNNIVLMSIEVETNEIFCNLVDDLVTLGFGKMSKEALAQFSKLTMSSTPRTIVEKAQPDLDITLMEAFEEMAASSEVGKYLQELDDTGDNDTLDNITMRAITDRKQKVGGAKKTMQVEDAAAPTGNKQQPKPRPVMRSKVHSQIPSTQSVTLIGLITFHVYKGVAQCSKFSLGKRQIFKVPWVLQWQPSSNKRHIEPEAKNLCKNLQLALVSFRLFNDHHSCSYKPASNLQM